MLARKANRKLKKLFPLVKMMEKHGGVHVHPKKLCRLHMGHWHLYVLTLSPTRPQPHFIPIQPHPFHHKENEENQLRVGSGKLTIMGLYINVLRAIKSCK